METPRTYIGADNQVHDQFGTTYPQQGLKGTINGELGTTGTIAPPAPEPTTASTPTVVTNANITDKKIPQRNAEATKVLTPPAVAPAPDATTTEKPKDDGTGGYSDIYKSLMGDSTTDAVTDPYYKSQMDLIDSMKTSNDSIFQNTLSGIRSQYQNAYSTQEKANRESNQQVGNALLRSGSSRYAPGSSAAYMSAKNAADISALNDLHTKEQAAISEASVAKMNGDYKTLEAKLGVVKDIRAEKQAQAKAIFEQMAADAKAARDAEVKMQEDISKIVQDAGKTGAPVNVQKAIANAKTPAEAVMAAGDYLNTGEYAEMKRAFVSEGLTPPSPAEYYAKKLNPTGGGGSLGGASFDAGNVPFQSTIENAASVESSDSRQKSTLTQLASLAQNGDYAGLLTRVQGQARKAMGTALGGDVLTAQTQIKTLDRMSKVLQEYQDAGGDVGILKGTDDQIQTKIGRLATDPKFKEIQVELKAAYQQYRQNLSGAAFGAKEDADYQSVFPSTSKSFSLNKATIDGLRNFYDQKVESSYDTQLGEGYKNIKDLADGKGDPKIQLLDEEKAAETQVQGLYGTHGAQIDEILKSEPSISNKDLLEILGVPMKSGGSVSVNIPPSSRLSYVNNNPGNLRFADQTGAVQGQGGFAKFPTPADGFRALKKQIQIDGGRGLSLAQFINKFAPPSENNTTQYIQQIASNLGLNPSAKLHTVDVEKLARAIAKKESSTSIG